MNFDEIINLNAGDLLRIGILEGAGTGWANPPTSWGAYVLGRDWAAVLMTRDREAGEAAMALPEGAPTASLADSGKWEVRSLKRRLLIREAA